MATEEIPGEIRAQLRSRRADCYLSYAEAAHLCGVSASTIKALEGPRGHITAKTLTALCHGYALAPPTKEQPNTHAVMGAETVRSIAKALIPLIEAGDPTGGRTLLDYYAIVDSLAAGQDPPSASVDGLVRLVHGALPPVEVIRLTSDLEERIGIAVSTRGPAVLGGFAGASPAVGPTPAEIGMILQSRLSGDTQQRLFSYVVKRHGEAIAEVENELESLINLLRAEIEQRPS